VIRPIKCDQGLRPSKVLWGSGTHSVDLLAHKLELTPGLVGDGSTVDRHDHLLPREVCHILSPRASLKLLALGERALEVMKFLNMVHPLSLCLMGYACFGQATLRSFLKCSPGCHTWRLKLRLAAATYSSSEPSTPLSSSLQLVVTATRRGATFAHFCCLWRLS
jgi:hypothetical protein